MDKDSLPKRTLWEHPWGYIESFVIAAELLIFGFILEFITQGNGISPLSLPQNLYVLGIFILFLIIVRLFLFQHPIVKWLSGVPAAISSIAAFGFITLLMGFIPQQDQDAHSIIRLIGLTHLKSSWPILLIQIFLLSSLGLVCLKRIIPFSFRNLGFLLNHIGLWIVLVAAMIGSGDLKRMSINLLEDGKSNNKAIGQDNESLNLPFEIRLIDFKIDEYIPRLVLVKAETGNFIEKKVETPVTIKEGISYQLEHWNITIKKYYHDVLVNDSAIIEQETPGSFPAALVNIHDNLTNKDELKTLGTGSYAYNPIYTFLNRDTVLALTIPQPKKFSSLVIITENNQHPDTVSIEVNHPVSVKGWTIYQMGYDESKGKWSKLSILEVVKDPWLDVVYTGIFMLMAGAAVLFWTGRKRVRE